MTIFEYIKLERTMCYGPCPIYKAKVDNIGNVEYYGIDFVRKEGKYTWKVPQEVLDELDKLIKNFNYRNFVFEPSGSWATDHPSCIITVKFIDGFVKTIDHDLGYFEYNKNLERFENKIDKLIDTDRVIK